MSNKGRAQSEMDTREAKWSTEMGKTMERARPAEKQEEARVETHDARSGYAYELEAG